ncbi:MarR family winged helix-turn-helix transcriptional regulator [Pseudonocardia sp. TRM90224]|uniref:MarR family winged helix-turn-helix transcriptional regulator n=1 Tax=Pseudonocardia sp. TRM90224 TaxID=2812678 RepID=UPI001E3B1757|nr:MarR family winged helix-turn-helix transcriptional regulator [Pseudonocardia sp. TRM90224]
MSEAEGLYDVVRRVRPLHLLAARIVTDSLAAEQVTMGIRAVLEVLRDGPRSVPDVGRDLLMPRQVVQRLCDQAQQLGLVERRPNPAHRRSQLIALTAEGERAFDRIHTAELRNLSSIAAELLADDIATARRVLEVLMTGMQRLAEVEGEESQ